MEKTKQAVPSAVPRHVAIIMDGNNRWAKKRFLPGVAGHKAGVDAVRAVIEVCAEAKVEVLTLFAGPVLQGVASRGQAPQRQQHQSADHW